MDRHITPKYESDEKKAQCCEETNAQLKRIADALEKLVDCSCPKEKVPQDWPAFYKKLGDDQK
ncbi:MAG: hypothetical protein KAY21_03945 [Limnohabitans sp.]|nr:hypothetical protein [Limnohabitans sp.]